MKRRPWSFILLCIPFFALTPIDRSQGESTAEVLTTCIIDLNQLTYSIANAHDQFYSFIGVRALAMTHLAIHDVLNTIEPEYQTYTETLSATDADPIAAMSQAARVVLGDIYPDRRDTIDLVCNKWLKQVDEDSARLHGIAFGNAVAKAILEKRQGDGHEKKGVYTPMTKPGDYQYTPGFDWVWKPDFSKAKCFVLDSVSQFRSPPPPPLKSQAYARAYDEVQAYGRKNSAVRTSDQTAIAHWWAEFGEHSWNRIGRITAQSHVISPHAAARMFALINLTLYDFYLVTFDSKYYYDTWRPVTAIQNGASDGNPHTMPEAHWEPEMVTPPWPEYPSAHAGVGAACAEIVRSVLGTEMISFTMQSVTALPDSPTRTYHSLDAAVSDCANSRIYNGYHFRFATEEGKAQGHKVAAYILEHCLTPISR